MADLRDEILSYMGKCRVCTIATADTDGKPNASAVFFKNNEFDIYFNTDRESEKAKNILTNPRIALVLQEDGPIAQTDKEIKGIQYVGTATTVTDDTMPEVPKAVLNRHRAFNSVSTGQSVIIKVTPSRIYMIDYSHGFRHRDVLEF
ncbi:MAG: pyridoxamine 5'-phosphate oxidase family protein [Chloroflexota bacterium]|nr:pyridoxamine 5'-phosphate oxidase family protein [Chloroflexota bacterium]